MAYEVEWAESALAGLVEAVEYIARDSPSYAASLAILADRAASSLSELPHHQIQAHAAQTLAAMDPVQLAAESDCRHITWQGDNLITV